MLLTNPTLSAVDITKVLGHADANLLFNSYGHSFRDAGRGVGERLDALRSSPTPTGMVLPLTEATGRPETAQPRGRNRLRRFGPRFWLGCRPLVQASGP